MAPRTITPSIIRLRLFRLASRRPRPFAAQDFATWLTVGGGRLLWDDLAAEVGVKSLLAGHSGAPPPLWSAAPLAGLSDLPAGKSMRRPRSRGGPRTWRRGC